MHNNRIIWKALEGSQSLALSCPANIILYDGTRGPGKTDTQLMRFRKRVGIGYGKFWRGVIFDREYKNLDDIVSKSQRWFPEFFDGAKFMSAKADYKWVWPTGEELLFRVLKKDTDYWLYHGQEFPFIGWNELTKYPTSTLFENMMSCNRSSFLPENYPVYIDAEAEKTGMIIYVSKNHSHAKQVLLPEIPLEVFATTNPFGVGHNWVKKKFIDPAPMGKIQKIVVNVFNPRTQKHEDVVTTICRIFGSYRENKYLNPKYVAELVSIKEENKRKAWLCGCWDVTSGGMFDDIWDSNVHIVPDFEIPKSWKIDRSFDYGSSKPFSVGWWATSDGSPITLPDGKEMRTIKGDLFRIAEWYGCEDGMENVGLRLTAKQIAKGIIERELLMGIHDRVQDGVADNSIWDRPNANSVASDMSDFVTINNVTYRGVTWLRSDKSHGSRKRGWEKIRIRLLNSIAKDGIPREFPGLFICQKCSKAIELLPITPRDETDPDDVDTNSEDHLADELRYKILGETVKIGNISTTGF